MFRLLVAASLGRIVAYPDLCRTSALKNLSEPPRLCSFPPDRSIRILRSPAKPTRFSLPISHLRFSRAPFLLLTCILFLKLNRAQIPSPLYLCLPLPSKMKGKYAIKHKSRPFAPLADILRVWLPNPAFRQTIAENFKFHRELSDNVHPHPPIAGKSGNSADSPPRIERYGNC